MVKFDANEKVSREKQSAKFMQSTGRMDAEKKFFWS